MTLRAHEQYACPSGEDDSARNLYFRLGTADHAIRFCPGCLAEAPAVLSAGVALAFMTVCPRHGLPLLECCDNCNAPCLFANTMYTDHSDHATAVTHPLRFMGRSLTTAMALQIELHLEFQREHVRRPGVVTTGQVTGDSGPNVGLAVCRNLCAFAAINVVSH